MEEGKGEGMMAAGCLLGLQMMPPQQAEQLSQKHHLMKEQPSLSLQILQKNEAPQPAVAATTTIEGQGRPWQRMKWTDAMVLHLIMVVYCVGEDAVATTEGAAGGASSSTTTTAATSMNDNNNNQPADKTSCKKKKGASGVASANDGPQGRRQQQQQQKKGKWKSVSKAMLGRGYMVSPQQCEDKFNDMNKQYKRMNELLGWGGIACRVVENHALLDTMDHLTPKAKDEARKLLNSRHLFFREMCAYHSATSHGPNQRRHNRMDGDEEESKGITCLGAKKRARTQSDSLSTAPPPQPSSTTRQQEQEQQQLKSELMKRMAVVGGREQQREWLKKWIAELEEKRVGLQSRAVELEEQRCRWLRFIGSKEREMERTKLENEQLSLDNDRLLLLLRNKEVELDLDLDLSLDK